MGTTNANYELTKRLLQEKNGCGITGGVRAATGELITSVFVDTDGVPVPKHPVRVKRGSRWMTTLFEMRKKSKGHSLLF